MQIVGELVHQDAVALQDRGLHGARRHDVPVGQRAPEDDHQGDENGKSAIFAPQLHERPLLGHAIVTALILTAPYGSAARPAGGREPPPGPWARTIAARPGLACT